MTKQFSVSEICEILSACRENGVGQLKIGGFSASFLPPGPQAPEVATPRQLQEARVREQEAFQDNEKQVRLEQLEQLRLSDPEAFEELVIRGELENVGEKSD